MVAPYLTDLTNEEQRHRWLPGFVAGERLVAIAMSEPGAGSDLKQIKATARRDGDHYVLNGTKTFISNGILADLVIVVARTDPEAGHRGMSLLVVEDGFEGFERGRKLDKIGNRAQDTAELFFRDVRVPAANLLGEEGRGFYPPDAQPARRSGLVSPCTRLPTLDRAFQVTSEYASDRRAFGQPVGEFQVNRFALAEMKTKLDVAHAYLDRCVQAALDGELDRGRGRRGQVVGHRTAVGNRGPLPAAARRIRLHQRVRDRPALAGCPGAAALRRHDRDHEGDRGPQPGLLSSAQARRHGGGETMPSAPHRPLPALVR